MRIQPILIVLWAAIMLALPACANQSVESTPHTPTVVFADLKGPIPDGTETAEKDIAAGVLRLKGYGLVTWRAEYARLLYEEHRIECQIVADCIVTWELVQHVDGYNKRMKEEIASRFGEYYLEDAAARAEANDEKLQMNLSG